MAIVTTKNGRKVQVVSAQNRMNTISKNDREMDARYTVNHPYCSNFKPPFPAAGF